jgi:hypothetical protein
MNLETFGRNLVDLLAERALDALRGATVDDVRRTLRGQLPASPAAAESGHVGTTLGAFALGAAMGAGLAALYTPTSGEELRTKLSRGADDARARAMALGDTIRTTAGKPNAHVRARVARAKRATPARAHHDA